MGNYFGLTKIKENLFSCLSPRLLENFKENFFMHYVFNSFKTPDYSSFQSESVSLLIEEGDIPPGLLSDEEIKCILNQSEFNSETPKPKDEIKMPNQNKILNNLKNSMFSLFSQNKNSKVLEEEKIEKPMEISKRSPLLPLPESHLHYTRVKKSEIEKEILLKRRRDPNVSMENIETSYKKRLTNMNKAISLKSFFQETNDMSCPICMDTIITANTTVCGHTFCELCLLESLLLNTGCPLCRTPLRTFQLTSSKALDQIIEKWVFQSSNKEVQLNYEKRKNDYEVWNESRKIKNADEGDELDVRDTEYIWCIGIVLKKIIKKNKPTIYLIHYQGWNKIYDEFISESSFRLAPMGFYTKRKDIPQYLLHSHNSDVMYGYVIIGNREINLNNNNNTNNNNNFQNVPNINNTNPDNNQIEEINLLENPHAHQIARSRTLARVGYTELRNILQIRINLSNENQANDININNRIPLSDDPIQERSSNNENNEVMSREISSNSNLGGNDDTVINELNQNLSVSQINPINDSLNMVSIANNTQEVRESEELLGMIEQANLRINPANSL